MLAISICILTTASQQGPIILYTTTCRSEPAPTFPEPVVRNLPRNLPGTRGSERGSETDPEPVVQNLPRNLPGTRDSEPAPEPSRNLPPGSRPGTAPEPILAKTP